jgi:hypothetical protein
VEQNERHVTAKWTPPTWLWVSVVLVFLLVLAALALRRPPSAVEVGNPTPDSKQTTSAEQATQATPTPVVAQTPNPPSSQDSEPQSSPDTSASVPAQANPTGAPANCYDNKILSTFFKETSQTRSQLAQEVAEKLQADDIYVSVGGEDNKYLLFVSTPENAAVLRHWATLARSDMSMRANWCTKGFAEVQFIVRDASMNQKLVSKFQTNAWESFRYMQQRGGATPVR